MMQINGSEMVLKLTLVTYDSILEKPEIFSYLKQLVILCGLL